MFSKTAQSVNKRRASQAADKKSRSNPFPIINSPAIKIIISENRYFYNTVYLKKIRQHSLKSYPSLLLFSVLIISWSIVNAQPITGFWKGKIDRKNVELKIVKNGDSLTGSSYYYESPNSYRRYSIKGYFDERDNSVVWWDDQLIEEKKTRRLFPSPASAPYFSTADFNCPGGTKMYLNGNTALKEKEDEPRGPVALQKSSAHTFNDEWDFVIDNYTIGTNDPELIDSIGKLAFKKPLPVETTVVDEKLQKPSPKVVAVQPKKKVPIPSTKTEPNVTTAPEPAKAPVITAAPFNNIQKFATRRKVILQEIPVISDSIELSFYDNAEVDGDSIAIFLNSHLLYEHIRLTEKAYTIKLAVADLQDSNELVMVAENLGSIPPNTSLMVAMVNGKRYETRLESTEQSSAAIRFIRKQPPVQ
jgi:hypothetical protein